MVWCWWCCHSIPNQDIGLPISYDAKTDTFNTVGHFCSFPCIKAYNHYENLSQKNTQYSLISLMYSKSHVTRLFDKIVCAPPRQCLKEFGGDMDITTFRNQENIVHDLQLPPMVKVNYVIDKQQTNWIRSTNQSNESSETTKRNTKIANNAIKIKPNHNKMNTLDSVLGIFPNAH